MPPIQYIPKSDIPERLTRIHPKLRRLYCRGTMPDFDAYKCLVVVGARKNTEYGEKVCRALIKGLAPYPVMIVSGLAVGIDSMAHEAALDNGMLTIAVPGSGLDENVIYPKSKLPLARKIIDRGGCLLSEYSSDEPIGAWVFPERNRVMAGLADAVLIVESNRKSGTMITARLALDYNKEIFTVPGSIFAPQSEGPHFLLQQGATPISSSRDIVEALGLIWYDEETTIKETQQNLFKHCSSDENEILQLLPNTKDELIRILGKPVNEINTRLSMLEIKRLIKEEAGKIYTV
jgi:DNA processing protein